MVAGQGTLGLELVDQVHNGHGGHNIAASSLFTLSKAHLPHVARYLCVQVPDMQFLFVAVGGGGLVSGLAAAVKATKPGVVVVGCQPAASPVMARR